MTEEEVEVVAEELAKVGGIAWYPGRQEDSLMRVVTERYRDRARVAIAALERLHASKLAAIAQDRRMSERGPANDFLAPFEEGDEDLKPGATVIYRPPGDRRAYSCRVVEIEGNRAYLAPILRACTDWVSIEHLMPSSKESERILAGE
ncbi:MAG TPA: hypothetical protein VE423_00490 [Microvirga sp.]|jgi:hypothetical protein|nr:hypothetical protein [Microvirga sp.]